MGRFDPSVEVLYLQPNLPTFPAIGSSFNNEHHPYDRIICCCHFGRCVWFSFLFLKTILFHCRAWRFGEGRKKYIKNLPTITRESAKKALERKS